MKRAVIIILLTTLISLSFSNEKSDSKIGLTQFLNASVLEGGCLFAGVSLFVVYALGTSEHSKFNSTFLKYPAIGIIALAPVGAAFGVNVIGKTYYKNTKHGSFGWSVLGAYTGTVIAGGIFGTALLARPDSPTTFYYVLYYASAVPALFLPQLGAVLGYQWSRSKLPEQGFFYNHLDPPSFGLKSEKLNEGKIIITLDFRLVNARF